MAEREDDWNSSTHNCLPKNNIKTFQWLIKFTDKCDNRIIWIFYHKNVVFNKIWERKKIPTKFINDSDQLLFFSIRNEKCKQNKMICLTLDYKFIYVIARFVVGDFIMNRTINP